MFFFANEYFLHLTILVCIYLILAQSLNLPFGLGRLFNLAHVAAYAIGAYATALLSTDFGASFWLCMVVGMLLAGLFSLLLGGIALRLRHDYFAIGTLAFHSILHAFLINWKSLTRGVLGVPGIPRPAPFGVELYENSDFLMLAASCAALTLLAFWFLFRGQLGRGLRAQAEFPEALAALGWNVRAICNWSFLLSSLGAAVAGSLFAYYLNYIDPSSFAFSEMVFLLTLVVVGGPGRYWGVIGGTIFLVLLPEPLRFTASVEPFLENLFAVPSLSLRNVPLLNLVLAFLEWVSQPSVLGPMRQLLYALILFCVVFWRRKTLFPRIREV